MEEIDFDEQIRKEGPRQMTLKIPRGQPPGEETVREAMELLEDMLREYLRREIEED